MASDDQKMWQNDALVAQAGSPVWGTDNPLDSRSSIRQIAALQSQLAQASQLRPDSAALRAQPNVVTGEQYLVFSLLECECAFKAEHIQGVERLVDVTPVPNVADRKSVV